MYGITEKNMRTKAAQARYKPLPELTVIPMATWVGEEGNFRRTLLTACDLWITTAHILAPINKNRDAMMDEMVDMINARPCFATPLTTPLMQINRWK
jgi:hypothetical protein